MSDCTDITIGSIDDELEYLCVDRYIATFSKARAVKTAIELNLIDYLLAQGPIQLEKLAAWFPGERQGLNLLLLLLADGGIIERHQEYISLTSQFTRALAYRDLLEMKLAFGELVADDFLKQFSLLIAQPQEFQRQAKVFRLFDYQKCFDSSEEGLKHTRQWVRITTILTKYEAGVCLRRHNFSKYRRVLDIGGNSGEFAVQLNRKFPEIEVTVFDLPAVCTIGREHVSLHGNPSKIRFISGNALTDALPTGY